jgi:hypothetical protein
VVAALEDGPAYPDELVESTGLTRGTIKNAITALKKAGRVEPTGEVRGQMEQVQLVAPAARPIKGSATSAAGEDVLTSEQVVAELNRWSSGARTNLPTYLKGQATLEALTRSVLQGLGKDPNGWQRHAAIVEEVAQNPRYHPLECDCPECL